MTPPRHVFAASAAGIMLDDDGLEPARLHRAWSPENNSSDSLELIMQLGLRVQYDRDERCVRVDGPGVAVVRQFEHSALHTARLAVFDAAVEVGKTAIP